MSCKSSNPLWGGIPAQPTRRAPHEQHARTSRQNHPRVPMPNRQSAYTRQMSPAAPPPPRAPAKARPRRKASWRAKLLLLTISLLICLTIFEIYARLAGSQQWRVPADALRQDSVFSYMYKPNIDFDVPVTDGGTFHLRTNDRGFRGPTLASIADRPFKVVSIGDSFGMGWGIQESEHGVTRFFDAYSKAHPERGVALATIACGGWSPDDYLFAFTTEVLPTKVDLVVVSVFPGNDILPRDYRRTTTPSRVESADPAAQKMPWWQPRLFGFVKLRLSGSMTFSRLAIRLGHVPEAFRRYGTDLESQHKDWDATYFYLDELVRAVRGSGAEVAILCYPSSIEVGAAETIDAAGFDHRMPEKMLGEFCQKRSVRLITLLDDLRAAKGPSPFFPLDRHLNTTGHEILLKALDKQLTPVVDELCAKKKAETK